MLCRKPYTKDGAAFPCGQCMPCRIRRKREWTHRIILESLCHRKNAFVTLTYCDTSLIYSEKSSEFGPFPILHRQHVTDFMKRLRRRIEPERMRYFGVGEYADDSYDKGVFIPGRPHYHMVAFGLACSNYISRGLGAGACCETCDIVRRAWGHGHVFLGQVTAQSAGYVAGYCVKKMTSNSDPRLRGRSPEFSFMSTDPGIGTPALVEVANTLRSYGLDETIDDVPNAARHGSSLLPYGRNMKRRLRRFIGRCEDAPPSTIRALKEGLLPLREYAFDNSLSFSKVVSSVDDGKVINMEARNALYKKGSKL